MQIMKITTRWTQSDYEFVKNNYLNMTDEEIGNVINKKPGGVKNVRQKMKLFRPRVVHNKKHKRPKATFDDITEMIADKGYILLSDESEYINQASKIRYICPIHRDKGEQSISVYHLKEGKGCYYCGREKTRISHFSKITADDDKKLCDIKGFEYIKTEIENGRPYIYFICPKHKLLGIQKMQRGNMNREGVQGCQYCYNKNLPHWYVKYMIESNFQNIDVLSEYHGMNKNITCKCKKHDIQFTTLAKYVYHDGTGCELCKHDKVTEKLRLSLDEVERRILLKNSDVEILNLEDYTGWEFRMKLKCKKCGTIWESPFHSIINNSGRCPSCQKGSLGEQVVATVLIHNNINFRPQYTFSDCCGEKRPMPFDFGILDNNGDLLGLIEYHGEQHYHPVKFFGGQKKFEYQVKHDKKKEKYCKDNNIKLLIIPYWQFKNIEDIVTKFINGI